MTFIHSYAGSFDVYETWRSHLHLTFFFFRYEPTIEEIHRKVITIDGEQCLLELMDTAGIDQFTQMTDVYIREGHGFILVYSVIDRASFEEVLILHEQIVKGKCRYSLLVINCMY